MSRTADEPPAAVRGVRVLRRLLREEAFDLRELDLAAFRDWLSRHLARWRRDSIFQARARIRDRRRDHPELRLLESEHRRAARADAASDAYPELQRLERAIRGAEQAVAGLNGAAERRTMAERAALRAKRDAFRDDLRRLQEERRTRIRSSPERRKLLRLDRNLRRLRASLGLDEREAAVARLLRERGRRGGGAGRAFEATTEDLVRCLVCPEVAGSDRVRPSGDVRVLRGVTLGAAKVELDRVVVRVVPGAAVEVLAVAEAKRNINDLAHGFRRRQEDLAWLTGGAGSGNVEYRTRMFPSGQFDREVIHEERGESFRFGPGSFRRFRRDPDTGLFLDRLYLVSRPGPVWGVSSAALSKINHRVATDERWDPDDEAYLVELHEWCRSLAGRCETPDLLRLLAEGADRAKRLILILG